MSPRRRQVLLTVAAALGGVALFAYAVDRVGAGPILASLRRVGWGFLLILALAGLRFVARTAAWRSCAPADARFRFGSALAAFLAGDALGNITPLGLAASEPTKALLARRHLATAESVSSLALDNLVYSSSVLAMIALGIIVMLDTVQLSRGWQQGAAAALVLLALVALAGWRLMRVTTMADATTSRWRQRLHRLHGSVVRFAAGNRGRLSRAFAFDVGFHALAILEGYVTLRWLLGDRSPTLSQAIVFEALNRVVTAVFKFVPFRVGVDEAASGAFAPLIAINPIAGVSLAVVRKVRTLSWAAVGLAIIAAHPVQGARATDRRGSEPAHPI